MLDCRAPLKQRLGAVMRCQQRRNSVIKLLMKTVVSAFAVAAVLLPVASQARSLDEILSTNKLVVGVNPTLPPLGKYNDKNEIVGFDVDLSQKLADMLGVALEIVKVG